MELMMFIQLSGILPHPSAINHGYGKMNGIPVIWAVQRIGAPLFHLPQGSHLMANTSITSQTTLLQAYNELKPWTKEVQGSGVHHMVRVVIARLLSSWGYVTIHYGYINI
jgi:hypothetical protein